MSVGEIRQGGARSLTVLFAAVLTCALILWGGGKLVGKLLATLTTTSAAVDETIASTTIFGLLLIAGLLGGKLTGVSAARLGPYAAWRFVQGLAIGLSGLLLAATFAAIAGVLHSAAGAASAGLLIWATALILLQSGSEEVFFRGWLQPLLVRSWGGAGVVVTAIVFAALHLLGPTRSIVSVANLFLGGLLFGLLAQRYQGLASAIGGHFAWNCAEQLLLGIDPNPGVGSFGSIWNADLVGNSWWGGSSEGLNASIAMTFALAILITPLVLVPVSGPRQRVQNRSGSVPA